MPDTGAASSVSTRRRTAPYFFLLALAAFASAASGATATGCPTPTGAIEARVRYVYDGDTVQLENRQRVRLLGINAPETAGRHRATAEPGAVAARERLQELLQSAGYRVTIKTASEKRDRYGRLLAYLFTADGANLGAKLLGEGLAFAIAVPPNMDHFRCYLAIEATAAAAGIGLWQRSPVVEVDGAKAAARLPTGFRIIRGRLRAMNNKPDFFIGGVRLVVPGASRRYFEERPLTGLLDRIVTARGWVSNAKNRKRLIVHHPDAIAASGDK